MSKNLPVVSVSVFVRLIHSKSAYEIVQSFHCLLVKPLLNITCLLIITWSCLQLSQTLLSCPLVIFSSSNLAFDFFSSRSHVNKGLSCSLACFKCLLPTSGSQFLPFRCNICLFFHWKLFSLSHPSWVHHSLVRSDPWMRNNTCHLLWNLFLARISKLLITWKKALITVCPFHWDPSFGDSCHHHQNSNVSDSYR